MTHAVTLIRNWDFFGFLRSNKQRFCNNTMLWKFWRKRINKYVDMYFIKGLTLPILWEFVLCWRKLGSMSKWYIYKKKLCFFSLEENQIHINIALFWFIFLLTLPRWYCTSHAIGVYQFCIFQNFQVYISFHRVNS